MKKLFVVFFLLVSILGMAVFSAFSSETVIKNARFQGSVKFSTSATPGASPPVTDVGRSWPLGSATAINWTFVPSREYAKTLSANTTFTFTNVTDGDHILVWVTNTASNYTVTWPTVNWVGSVVPTQTTGAKTDRWSFWKINNTIFGSVEPNFGPPSTPTATATATNTATPTNTATATATATNTATPTATATATATPTATIAGPLGIAGLKLWLKADAESFADNDPVGTWTDYSTTSNNATAAGSLRPTFKTNQINTTLPVVRFDGVDDKMTFPNDPGQPTTTFVVGRINDIPANQQTYATFVITSPGTAGLRLCATLGTTAWGSYSNAADFGAGETLNNGTFYILELTASASESKLYRGGTLKGTSAFGIYGSTSTNSIGADNYLKGDIAEIIIYDTVLSTGNRNTIESYLQAKYGL